MGLKREVEKGMSRVTQARREESSHPLWKRDDNEAVPCLRRDAEPNLIPVHGELKSERNHFLLRNFSSSAFSQSAATAVCDLWIA